MVYLVEGGKDVKRPSKEGNSGKSKESISDSDVHLFIFNLIDSKQVTASDGQFFSVIANSEKRIPIKYDESSKVVTIVTIEVVISAVSVYLRRVSSFAGQSAVIYVANSIKKIRSSVDYWMMATDTVNGTTEFPSSVEMKSSNEFCFKRMSFDFDFGNLEEIEEPFEETTTFDSFLDRCSQPKVLMAWVGSLIFDKSDRSQYIWLYGKGNDGKSEFVAALMRELGNNAGLVCFAENTQSRFWPFQLMGKRLCNIQEAEPGFPASGKFKSLTGENRIFVEPKGKDGFVAEIDTKFIFASNEPPNINHGEADQRRLIMIDVAPFNDVKDKIEVNELRERYDSEIPNFMRNCLKMYIKDVFMEDLSVIPYDRKESLLVADLQKETEIELLENHFDFSSNKGAVLLGDFKDFLWKQPNRPDAKRIKEVLNQKYNIEWPQKNQRASHDHESFSRLFLVGMSWKSLGRNSPYKTYSIN